MVAPGVVEAEAAGVVSLTPSRTPAEEEVAGEEALQVRRREGLEVEEGTFCLAAVEGRLHLAWTEAVVEVQP